MVYSLLIFGAFIQWRLLVLLLKETLTLDVFKAALSFAQLALEVGDFLLNV